MMIDLAHTLDVVPEIDESFFDLLLVNDDLERMLGWSLMLTLSHIHIFLSWSVTLTWSMMLMLCRMLT